MPEWLNSYGFRAETANILECFPTLEIQNTFEHVQVQRLIAQRKSTRSVTQKLALKCVCVRKLFFFEIYRLYIGFKCYRGISFCVSHH